MASVTGNSRLSGQHLVDFAGDNWIRIRATGPNGVAINVDVGRAAGGRSDGSLFKGDSITASLAGHDTHRSSTGLAVRGLGQLAAAASSGRLEPLVVNGGVGCAYSSGALTWVDGMLDGFHGTHVTLSFGTNDSWGGQGDPTTFYANMERLIAAVEDRGLTAVVPTIAWPNNPGVWDSQVRAMNDQVNRHYREHPIVVKGPDLYSFLAGPQSSSVPQRAARVTCIRTRPVERWSGRRRPRRCSPP